MLELKVGQVYFNRGNALYYLVTTVDSTDAYFETFGDVSKIYKGSGVTTSRSLDDIRFVRFELFRDVETVEEAKDFQYGDIVYLLPDAHPSYALGEEGVAEFCSRLNRHDRNYEGQWLVTSGPDSDGDMLIEQGGVSYYVLPKFLSRVPVKVDSEPVEDKEAEPMSEELSSETLDFPRNALDDDMGSVSVKALADAAYYVGLAEPDLSKLVSLAKRLDNFNI